MTTVAAAQVRVDDTESVADRVDRVTAWVRAEARQQNSIDMIVLPELWSVGAFSLDQILSHAEPIGGPFTERMSQLAAHLGVVLHAGSLPEAHTGGVSNTSVVFGPDGALLASYRKIHLFGFDTGEAVLLSAGRQPTVVDTPVGVTGLTTCYDLRFPELYRELVDLGARAYVVPAGWPQARMSHWRVLAHARAVENQAVVVACNAVGVTGGVAMGGGSVIVSADGRTLAEATDEEQFLTATLEPAETERWRAGFPALRDRRGVAGPGGSDHRDDESTGG